MLKNGVWLFHPKCDKAQPAARDGSEVARSQKQRCYPHTGNGGHSWCSSSSLFLSVGFSIQDEAVDVARSAPQGAHYHADAIYLLRISRFLNDPSHISAMGSAVQFHGTYNKAW